MACAQALCLAIAAWLSAHGYDPDHRDAVLRQIAIESNFVACPRDTRHGTGLMQWAGIRRKRLWEAAGVACPSWEAQMAFIDDELRGGLYTGFWRASGARAFIVLRRSYGEGL